MTENGSLDEAGFLESLSKINRGEMPAPRPGGPRPRQSLQTAPRPAADPEPTLDHAAYETFYGFHDHPFGPAPDLRFLYHSASHDAASEALLNAISRRDSLTVLTGQSGIGKTLLCGAVLDQLDRRTMTSFIRDPRVTLDDLLERALVDFGVMSRDDSRSQGGRHDALTAALQSFSASLASLQGAAVIVIDDAHRLANDVAEHLDILMSGGGAALVLILVGEPPLLKMLKRPALRALDERVAARVALGPLAADEVPGYIASRLRSAGDAVRVDFDDQALAVVGAVANGVPAIVNRVCDGALTRGAEASLGIIDAPTVEQAARDLNLTLRDERTSAMLVVTLLIYFSLLGLGGAAAAWLFWDRIAQILHRLHG